MIRRFPSVFVLVFIIVGIVLADQSRVASWPFLLLSLVLFAAALYLLARRSGRIAVPLFGGALLFFSAFHFSLRCYDLGPNHLAAVADPALRYRIFGHVSDWPDLKPDRTEIKVDVDSIIANRAQRVHGAILLRLADTTTRLQRGDGVDFFGRIYPVKGRGFSSTFDYQRCLSLKGVFGIVYLPTLLDVRVDRANRYAVIPVVDGLRRAMRTAMYDDLSPAGAALAAGFLIGETRDIPTNVYRHFRDSGTLHLLAVSGSNVALVILFLAFILRPLALSPGKRALVLMTAVALFAMLSYGEPSVMRASLMAGLVILAGQVQRRYDLNNIIAVAAVIILLVDPAQLFDVGFQLSFVIAWGLIFVLPRLAALFRPVQNRRWYRWLVFPLLVSLVAQLCSAGLIAYHFGRIPLISPVANLIIVPLVSAAVVGILVMLAAHLVLPLLGSLVGSWLDLLLDLILVLIDTLGGEHVPVARMANLSAWIPLIAYFFLFAAVVAVNRRRLRRLVLASLLVMLNIVLAAAIYTTLSRENRTRVDIFPIPGGVAAAVHHPGRDRTDLVITDIASRPYPVDSRVLDPCLTGLGVGDLDAVFVLAAQFNAIDDLLRLFRERSARHLYIDHRLKSSFGDVIAQTGMDTAGLPVATFGGQPADSPPSRWYYAAGSDGLVLHLDRTNLLFCSCLDPDRAVSSVPADIVVTGSLWRVPPGELAALSSLGVRQIFCSKFAHPTQPTDFDARTSGQAVPPAIHDLSLLGPATVKIPRE
ncbi:MAG: ComEC/Rec2 family competence protein [Candidatus Zixiibacteriota bacterium]|nr:MAG: ComEC/Rec2 family competence protein [candidate division Zixibacteria bacterium]